MTEKNLLLEKIPGATVHDIRRLSAWQADTLEKALRRGVGVRRYMHGWQFTPPGWKLPAVIATNEGLQLVRPADFR